MSIFEINLIKLTIKIIKLHLIIMKYVLDLCCASAIQLSY